MAEMKYPLALVVRAVDKLTAPIAAMNAKATKAFRPLNVGLTRLGSRLTVLGKAVGVPKLVERLQGAGEAAGNFSGALGGVVGTLTGLATAALFGGLGIITLVRSAEAAGSRLEDLSTLTGLTVNGFAELEYAAKRSGVENEQFAAGMRKFNKSLSEAKRNAGPLYALLSKVGPIYARQLKGVKSNEEGFTLIAKAMAKIQDPGKRAELAAAAFGEAGAGLVLALKDGPDAVNALREEYRKLAGDQTKFAAGAGALGDSLDNLDVAVMGARNAVAGALFPAMTKLADAFTTFLSKHRDSMRAWAERTGAAIEKWVDGGGLDRLAESMRKLGERGEKLIEKVGGLENAALLAAAAIAAPLLSATASLVVSLGQVAAAVLPVIARLGALLIVNPIAWAVGWVQYLWLMRNMIWERLVPAIAAAKTSTIAWAATTGKALVASLAAATKASWAFVVSLLANPITWVVLGIIAAIAALAGIAYLIYKYWDPIKAFFVDLWEGIKKVVGAAADWLGKKLLEWGVVDALLSMWEPVAPFFTALWDGIKRAFSAAWDVIKPIVELMTGYDSSMTVNTNTRTQGPEFVTVRPPPTASNTTTRVEVDFKNTPKGTYVTATPDAGADFDLNLGYTMRDPA